jgi:nucleoporin GLE1
VCGLYYLSWLLNAFVQSTQIFDQLRALDPNSDIYPSALSALAKVIILQAETEVTAKLDTATPLAAVVINLFNIPGFDEVLWSKMVIRTGGWLIGHCVTRHPGQDEKSFRKMAAYREDEVPTDRQTRIGGVLSLYFAISTSSRATRMLPAPFWPTKIWSFFARLVGDARLLRQTMAPYVSAPVIQWAYSTC